MTTLPTVRVALLQVRDYEFEDRDGKRFLVDADTLWKSDECGGIELVLTRVIAIHDEDGVSYGRTLGSIEDGRLQNEFAELQDVHKQVVAELKRQGVEVVS